MIRSPLPALTLALCSGLAIAAPSPAAQAEIAQLLAAIERSGCQMQRNGSWHDAAAARAHIEKKYRYLLDKDLVHGTAEFIEMAASRSSRSGQAYQVRCGTTAPVTSAQWLQEELRRLRERSATGTR
jgi:hypothetical protein